jgi:hypothetical protein
MGHAAGWIDPFETPARFETGETVMAQGETELGKLPVAIGAPAPRPSLKRTDSAAPFISQLLAERANLPPQRARRRTTAEGAVGAYASGAKIAVKRMPMGYRTSIVA